MAGRSIIIKIILDICCFIAALSPLILIRVWAKPFKRGFYCDDESIRYPYRNSTPTFIATVGLGVPTITIVIVEYVKFSYLNRRYLAPNNKLIGKKEFHPVIWHSYARIGVFHYGALLNLFATDIGKYSVGRLRPHFLSVCRPSFPDPCNHTYLENITCMDEDQNKLREIRLSFPSSQASLSAYSMIYLVIYLQSQMQWKGSVLFKSLLQSLAFSYAFFTGLSKISDYQHHWSDVLAGFAIGTIVSILTALFTSDLIYSFKKKTSLKDSADIPIPNVNNPSTNTPVLTGYIYSTTLNDEKDKEENSVI